MRSHGLKVGQVSDGRFVGHIQRLLEAQPALREILTPLLELWVASRHQEAELTRQVKTLARQDDLVKRLMRVPGVGLLTAVTYIATIDNPRRFKRGKQVAACVGLVPSIDQSGEVARLGPITKEGDGLLRGYLAEAAQSVLFVSRRDTALKRWGQELMGRKGTGKARVAVARKLAMLLHRLWLTGEDYQAFPEHKTR